MDETTNTDKPKIAYSECYRLPFINRKLMIMKKEIVYGVEMTSLENMIFSKYVSNNNIAMNTKTINERTEITLNWLKNERNKVQSLG